MITTRAPTATERFWLVSSGAGSNEGGRRFDTEANAIDEAVKLRDRMPPRAFYVLGVVAVVE